MDKWIVNRRGDESSCPGCGGTCDAPPDTPSGDSPLGTRRLVLGSIAFFIGPILLAISAAALFDDGAPIQLAATAGALVGGMSIAWLIGRLFGFSREDAG